MQRASPFPTYLILLHIPPLFIFRSFKPQTAFAAQDPDVGLSRGTIQAIKHFSYQHKTGFTIHFIPATSPWGYQPSAEILYHQESQQIPPNANLQQIPSKFTGKRRERKHQPFTKLRDQSRGRKKKESVGLGGEKKNNLRFQFSLNPPRATQAKFSLR